MILVVLHRFCAHSPSSALVAGLSDSARRCVNSGGRAEGLGQVIAPQQCYAGLFSEIYFILFFIPSSFRII